MKYAANTAASGMSIRPASPSKCAGKKRLCSGAALPAGDVALSAIEKKIGSFRISRRVFLAWAMHSAKLCGDVSPYQGVHALPIRVTIASLLVLIAFSSPIRAQSTDAGSPPPLPSRTIPMDTAHLAPSAILSDAAEAERATELKQWVHDFTAWIEWSAEWGNRRERGWFTASRDRRQKPTPPVWLDSRCETVFDDADPLSSACALLAEWRKDSPNHPVRSTPVVAAAHQEDDRKTIWWEHLHADVLWPAMQWQASVYGVVGMHVATTVRGRFQVFIAPGAMLLNVPARNGTRVWKIAANYGIGYRLFDFTFPGNRPAALHVNLAKAWLLSDVKDAVTGRSTDFVGFSVSFKKFR
jgi:hypothetical protein